MDEFKRKPVNRLTQDINATPTPAQQNVTPQVPEAPVVVPTQPAGTSVHAPQPIADTSKSSAVKPKKSKKKRILLVASTLLGIIVLVAIGGLIWYSVQLSAVNSADTTKKFVQIKSGSSPSMIANTLKEEGVIRSQTAFLWYTRLEGVQNQLQAGSYRLSPSESTQEIVGHLVNGKVDTFDVTLFPGATLVDNTSTPSDKKYDVTTALRRAGFTDQEITAGLSADYSDYATTLFQGRPAGADLEGYIYGETYRLSSSATVEDVLRASFEQYWKVIQTNNLVAAFQARGMSLYEGITLASIIQRESGGDDKAQIAQVFYKRLGKGMPLGSDVTYQYVADKLGVARDTNLESPYNTRIKVGLPPGPIAVPGGAALIAAANPAAGDYEYFLSGDDDITYFATTLEEHEANIRNHCQQKCQII